MENLSYVCLYNDYIEGLSAFTDEEVGRLARAMIRYNATGEVPEFTGNERFIWPTLQAQMDRDRKAYAVRCENNRRNGKKGGRPKNASADTGDAEEITEGFSEEPTKPNKKEKENEKENEKEKEKENEKKNEKEKEKESENKNTDTVLMASPRAPFFPPSESDIREYCNQMGYHFDPMTFMDHYRSNGWMVGKNPMRDWQAALRSWNAKEAVYPKPAKIQEPERPTWTVGTTV